MSAFDLSNAVNKKLLGSADETKYPFESKIPGVALLPPLTTNENYFHRVRYLKLSESQH